MLIFLFMVGALAKFNCTVLADCSKHGVCAGVSCICDNGFSTHPEYAVPQCNQRRKSRTVAALFSASLLQFGVARFYLGYNTIASGQIIFYSFGLCIIALVSTLLGMIYGGIATSEPVLGYGVFTWFVTAVVWWCYELMIISDGTLKDSNGLELL